MTIAAILLALYFALLTVVARWRSAPVASPVVQLLRAFFPSWRFFEDVGDVGTLYVRTGDSAATLGDWRELLPRPCRRPWHLLLAPENNFLLACRSLVQVLEAELDTASEAADSAGDDARTQALADGASYRLVEDLVRFTLRSSGSPATQWQWKLHSAAPGTVGVDLLTSPILPLSGPSS